MLNVISEEDLFFMVKDTKKIWEQQVGCVFSGLSRDL